MPVMGRPNPLSDPEFAQKVAEALAEGYTRQQMCNIFGIKDRNTISRWKRDPRVKKFLKPILSDRIQEVTRKVDSKIAAILENDSLTVQELIAIRKEYLGGALRDEAEKADDITVNEAMKAIDDPAFQKDFAEMVDRLKAAQANQE